MITNVTIGKEFFFRIQVAHYREYGRTYVSSVFYRGRRIKKFGNHLDEIIEKLQTPSRHE